ncbi:Arabinanase/levansucrase/invertase [Aureobasidium pullulans]|uniref:Arabinanase/levansucrase/invertase n=1 Tax=Aureobasidium pullulans TaxID=5580 RepID=A0A4S9JFT1_AURPU|nr:Arabinanase/levansucrase/invertase [Aureobasidium pullulans]
MAYSSINDQNIKRWRPGFHIIPKTGWTNDPCALGYHAARGLYIVGFQWNPNGWQWSDISWGVAQSSDSVNWKVLSKPSLQPSKEDDSDGIFTGCMVDMDEEGQTGEIITSFYTSAHKLPIHYTLPHQHGSELLHMATSSDCGRTWQRYPGNPILPGPPPNVAVTGWRDPFVFRWASMDRIRQSAHQRGLYGIIAGGISGTTPTIFLYSLDPTNLTRWTLLSTLVFPGLNLVLNPLWGDFGMNWEVTNIATLKNEIGRQYEAVIVGVEGCQFSDNDGQNQQCRKSRSQSRPLRTGRAQKWFSGSLSLGQSSQPLMKIE